MAVDLRSTQQVESATRRRLLAIAGPVHDEVDDRVYKFRLEEKVDGTGLAALVVARDGAWAPSDLVQSSEFPIARIRIYVDPSRDSSGDIAKADAADRAFRMWRLIDKELHGVTDEWWGAVGTSPGMLVVSCQRWAEPFPVTQSDLHGVGAPRGEELGDSMFVSAAYALHVVH